MNWNELNYWNNRTYGKIAKVTDKSLLMIIDRIIPTLAIPTIIYLFLERKGILKPKELFRFTTRS